MGFVRFAVWVSCLTVAACVTTESRGFDRDPPSPLATALASRRTPEIVLPNRPMTSLGRCAVEIGPRPPETHQRVLAELVARNGTGWETTDRSFDPLSGTLHYLQRTGGGGTSDRSVPASDDEARTLALAFFVENYDLFGLSASDLVDVRVYVTGDDLNPPGAISGRTVELAIDFTPTESEESTYGFWRATLTFERQGPLRFVDVQSERLLPEVPLCDRPALGPDDDRVRAAVLGYHLSYGGADGVVVDVGDVTADLVTSTTLITHRAWSPEGDRVVVQRAYEILVGGGWAFIVDAETGERLAVYQLFVT